MATKSEESEVSQLRLDVDREHQMYLRALADFDNFRRRVEQENEAQSRRGKRALLLSILEVLDSFDRAVEHLGDDLATSEGVRAIHRQLQSIVEAQGVTPFESAGATFDPRLHEPIGTDSSTQQEPGTITEQVRRGYRWGEDLLRPARVRVAQ